MGKFRKETGALLTVLCAFALFGAGAPCVIFGGGGTTSVPTNRIWRSVGPGGGGWIQATAWSRHRADRFFIGCDVGGFYVSENRGVSYEMRNVGLTDYWVEDIVEHPTDPDTLYVATASGVFKSTDLGRTWVQKRNGFPAIRTWAYSAPVSRIVLCEEDPRKLYAAIGVPKSRKGGDAKKILYRSTDGGETWTDAVSAGQLADVTFVMDLSVDSRDWNTLLIATTNGVFRSTDGGSTWTASSTGLPSHLRVQRLARSRSAPDVVYATLRQKAGETPWSAGVYRSDDGGLTWSARNNGLANRPGQSGTDDMYCSWYDRIQVHPSDPNLVYIGGATYWTYGVWRTTDGGRNWSQLCGSEIRQNNSGWLNFWGPTAMTLAMSTVDPDRLAFGTSGMVYATEDGGATWPQRYTAARDDGLISSCGLEVTCLHSIVPDRYRKNRFFLGYYDIGLMVTDDNGRTMRRPMTGIPATHNNSCFGIAQSRHDPNLCWGSFGSWASGGGGLIAKSTDAGSTWSPCTNAASGWIDAAGRNLVLVEAEGVEVLMYRNAQGLVRSANGGETWQPVPTSVLPVADRISSLNAVGDVLYAGCTSRSGSQTKSNGPGGVWKSTDGGRSWTAVTPSTLTLGEVTGVAVDGPRILVTVKSVTACAAGAFVSLDGGVGWRRAFTCEHTCRAPLFAAGRMLVASMIDPYRDNPLGDGLMLSEDDGATWTPFNADIPNLHVSCLALDPFRPTRLWAGTGGNSVFVRHLPWQGKEADRE